MNTPKENRNNEFYLDAFTSASSWGPGEFEKFMQEIGFTSDDPDDFFGRRAWRVWASMTEAQKNEFSSNYDDWLDS